MPTRLFCVLVALALAAVPLVGCGDRSALLPRADAVALKGRLGDVNEAVRSRECARIAPAIQAAQQRVDELPAGVDRGLRSSLRRDLERLRRQAVEECTGASTEEKAPSTPEPSTTTDTTPEPPPTTDTTPQPTAPRQAPSPAKPPKGDGNSGKGGGSKGNQGGSGGGGSSGSGGASSPSGTARPLEPAPDTAP